MKIKNSRTAILCNHEVFSLAKATTDSMDSSRYQAESPLSTIIRATSRYLQEQPCKNQTSTQIDQLLTLLKDFPIRLTKLEKLMICNEPPKTPLQLDLILKLHDTTLSDEDIESWLQKIKETMA